MKRRTFSIRVLVLAFVLTAMLGSWMGLAQRAGAASVPGAGSSALEYLKSRQQADGGFAEPGSASSGELTGWVVMGLAAAGEDVGGWRKGGKSPIDFLAAHAAGWSKLTDLEKYCLALSSAGVDARSFAGRNLVEDIKARMGGDGHIGDMVNEHCWGMIALTAAGEKLPDGCRTWLEARQNIDGGFGYAADSGSDPDDTGAALQALMAAGEDSKSNLVTRALSFLHFCQADDGGFAWQADESNVGSTAWAAQGVTATGAKVGSAAWAKSGKTPLDFLTGQQQSDGHYRHMASTDTNPTWMTAEAIPALLEKPYPFNVKPPADRTTTSTTVDDNSDPAAATVNEDTSADPAADPSASTPAQSQNGVTSANGKSSAARKSVTGKAPASGVSATQAGGGGAGGKPGGGILLFVILCGAYLAVLGLAYLGVTLFVA